MNNKFYLLSLFLLALAFASCEETQETGKYDNWQERNEAFIDSLQNVYSKGTADNQGRKLERLELLSDPGKYLFYKRLKPITELPGYQSSAQKPLYTNTVYVFYKGTNILKERFDGFMGVAPTVFDKPRNFEVNKVVTGWTEALQHMNLGERWEVYIPWQYGYGAAGTTDIPCYSTLIFDMQLHSIE